MLSETKFLALYQRQQESGLSVKEFCANEGVAYSTFYYWYKKTKPRRGKQEFIPLVVKPSQPAPPQAQGYLNTPPPVHESMNPGEGMLLEVEYPNGTRLRIKQDLDLAHLRTLVCLLD
jgi:hypothetical protein